MKKLILAIAIFLGASPLWAELMTYQGRLKESGIPVTGNRLLTFEFCDQEDGSGACFIAPGTPASFAVANGLFKSTITIHPNVDLAVGAWYLRVTVGSSVLTPLERLTAVPYSVFASSAGYAAYAAGAVLKAGDTMTGQLTLDGSTLTITGSDFSVGGSTFVVKQGSVGIGTASPNNPLEVWTNGQYVFTGGAPTSNAVINLIPQVGGTAMINNNADGSVALAVGHVPHLVVDKDGNVGVGSALPSYRLSVSSGAGEAGTIMAVSTGASNLFWVAGDGAHATKFYGDGSGLSGVTGATDNTKVLKTGDTMTGPLYILSDDLANDTSDFITTGLVISTGGAIQTTGLGHGTAVGNARGKGAVDLQSYRSLPAQVASGNYSVLSGGFLNRAVGAYSAVGGGYTNSANTGYATVGGGIGNTASGLQSTVAGGDANAASGQYSAVGGGNDNRATGMYSAVPGGYNNTAEGNYSFAAGGRSSSTAQGAFTWQDSGGAAINLINNVTDRTVFKSRGGFLVTGSTNTSITGTLDRAVFITGNGLVGVSTGAPQAALDVVSTGNTVSDYAQIWRDSSGVDRASVTATGVFYGNGSGLTGVTAAGAVQKAGDTMQGTLDMGGNFLAGVSTITMLNGSIAIVPPGTGGTNHTYGISIGSGAYNNYTYGVGLGNNANDNYFYGVGVGHIAQKNNNYGVGVGYGAHDNYNSGVGIGQAAAYNSDSGVGVGSNASGNDSYAVGIGAFSKDNRPYGAALGAYSYASSSATALGAYAKANAELSLALGYGTVNNSTGTASFGSYGVNAPYYQVNGSTVMAMLPGLSSLAVGPEAGRINTGAYNVFVGSAAGRGNPDGTNNTMVGFMAGYANDSSGNTFIGSTAGSANTTGSQNIVIGYNQQTSAAAASSELNIGGLLFGQLGAKTVGISTRVPQAALDIVSTGTGAGYFAQIWRDSTGLVVSSVNSQGIFYGNGSGLTGVTAAGAVQKAGDTMTGALNMNGNFLAGVSTITMLGGSIAIVPPGTGGSNNGYGISIGSNSYNNYSGGVGVGREAYGNYTYGVGVGAATYNNYTYGVGVGSNAAGNYDSGVGLGRDSYGNYDHGTGLGAGANENRVYGLGAGFNASANRNYGVGLGAFASGNNDYAVGVGAYSQNSAGYGAALGAYSYAASSATALGAYAEANAELSLALGYGTVNNSTGTASFGNYGIYTSTAVNAAYYQVNGSTVLALTNSRSMGVGVGAGRVNTGQTSLFVGDGAGYASTGDRATFVGVDAGRNNLGASNNSFLGMGAGYAGTTGVDNTAAGAYALYYNITGARNVSLGLEAGMGTGVGQSSISSSTLVGYRAGTALLTGSYGNVLLGFRAGDSIGTGSRNIVIGYDADAPAAAISDHLNIGGLIYGDLAARTVGISTRVPQAALDVVSTGTGAGFYAQIWRDSTGLVVSSVGSQGIFYGDGSGLRNITADGAVQKTGDVMDGPLYLDGTGGSNVSLKITRDSAGELITAGLSAGATMVISADSSSVGIFSGDAMDYINIGAGMNTAMTVTQNRVGVNNIAPVYSLDVNGNGRFTDQVIAGGSVTVAGNAFSVGASTFVVSAGRVGINWSTPEAALQVGGGAKFLSSPGTSYILTAGSSARPDMFFVSSSGIVGVGDFTGISVDTYSVASVAQVLKSGADGAVGLSVFARTDKNATVTATGPEQVLAGGNFEAAVGGDDSVTLLAGLRAQLRRESAGAGGGVVSKAYGLIVDDIYTDSGAGVITDTYGIYIGNQSSSFGGMQTNAPYAIYSQDPEARSYLAGNLGLGYSDPVARLELTTLDSDPATMGQIWRNSLGNIVSSMSATGVMKATKFIGDGSGLTNIPGVQKTGDTMTGALTMSGSSITIRNSFGYEGLEIRDPGAAVIPELRLARNDSIYWDIGGAGGGTPLAFQYSGVNRLHLTAEGNLTINDVGQIVSRVKVRPDTADAYSLFISSADGSTPALTVRPGGELYTAGRVGIGLIAPTEALDISGRVQISTRAGGNDVTDGLLSHGAGGIEFYSGGTRYMKVANGGGYIGIGPSANVNSNTMSPKLQVKGSMSVGSTYGTYQPPANSLVLEGRLGVGTPAPDAALSVVQSDVAVSSYTVHIGTSASAYHLVVTTAGWVGLNTRQPQAPLHLTAATKDEGIVVEHNSDTAEGSYLALLKARGTTNSQALVQDGDNLGVLAFGGYNATSGDPFPMAAAIVGRVDGTPTISAPDMPGRLEFMTAADGTNETVTRMVIRSDGGVGIATGTPQAMLDIRSTSTVAQIWRDNAGVARATMTASGVLYAVVGSAVQKTGDTMTGNLSINVNPAVYASDFNTTGIRVSTAGSITTMGLGNGIATPNQRGSGAVDLQTARALNSQVALGDFSTLSGGAYNTVQGSNTVVGGGTYNIAAGTAVVISGGENNYANARFSAIGGGKGNTANADHAAVFSGQGNLVEGPAGFIGGGQNNTVEFNYGAIAGGMNNTVGPAADYGFIGGGYQNTAEGTHSAVAGGWSNTAQGMEAFVGAGYMNVANGEKSVVGGGTFNTTDAQYGVITGGYQNKMQSSAIYSFIGGGRDNTIAAGMEKAVIVGGSSNTVSGLYGFIGGGGPLNPGDLGNRVQADYSAIVGGSENLADTNSWMSFIGGGSENTVSGQQSVVAGGWMNTAGAAAEQYAGVVAGWGNKALGGSSFVGAGGGNQAAGDNSVVAGGSSNMATGGDSAVPGGSNNTAKGNYSFAAGYRSSSTAAGAFTWSDSQGVATENSVPDQVRFKARGGFVVSGSTNTADPKFMVTGAGDALLDNDRTLAWGVVPAPYITGNDSSDLLAFGLTGGEKMKLQSSQLTLYNASVVLSTNGPNAGITFQDGSVQTSAAPKAVSVYKAATLIKTLDASPAPDPDLQFNIGANEKWAFEFNLYVYTTDPSGVADFRVGLVGPTPVQVRAQYDMYAENGLTVLTGGVMAAYGEQWVNWTGTMPGVGTRVVIKGTVENGAGPGTVAITWSQNTASAVNTNVLKGSSLIANKLN